MLRAVRLAAKLGCTIDRSAPRRRSRGSPSLIQNVPPARLFDEMQKLLLSGHATETLASLRAHGLLARPAAALDVILEQPLRAERFIEAALANTDARVREGQRRVAGIPVRHAALARGAAAVEHREGPRRTSRCRRCSTRWTACSARRRSASSMPRRFEATIKEIWSLQPRFEQRAGSAAVPPARASALPRRVRLPAAARRRRARRRRRLRLVDALPGCESRRARGDAEARRGAEEAAPLARPRAQARRRRRRRRRGARRRRAAADDER